MSETNLKILAFIVGSTFIVALTMVFTFVPPQYTTPTQKTAQIYNAPTKTTGILLNIEYIHTPLSAINIQHMSKLITTQGEYNVQGDVTGDLNTTTSINGNHITISNERFQTTYQIAN